MDGIGFEYGLGLLVAVLVGAYLLYALAYPQRF